MADEAQLSRAQALAEPERKVAIDLLTRSPIDPEGGGDFAALTLAQRRNVYEAVLPEWADVLELACAQSGHVPLLLGTKRTRLPRHPELAAKQFWQPLRGLVRAAPGDPGITAERAGTWWDGRQPRNPLSDSVGAFVGIACDLPEKKGARIFEALSRAATRQQTGPYPLEVSCVTALITSQRPEAWDLLLALDKSGAFGWAMPVEQYYFGGRLVAANRLMETLKERYDAWPESLASYKSQIDLKVVLPRLARLLQLLNNPEARRQLYDRGSPAEVIEALEMEMTIDLSQAAVVAAELRRSPDPVRRAQGIWITNNINAGGFPAQFEPDLYEDPDERVRLCCLRLDSYANVGPGEQAAHFQRLERLLPTLQGSVEHTIPGVPGSQPVDRDYVFLNMASCAEPLDPLVPYVEQFNAPYSRRQLARIISKRAARRPLTPLETAMLGRLGADRSRDTKAMAVEIMTRLGIDPAQASAAWKKLGVAPAKTTAKKPVLGKWPALLDRRAKAMEASVSIAAPASEASVAELEKKLQVILPPQLRELLLEANGMRDTSDSPREIAGVAGIAAMTQTVREQTAVYQKPPRVAGAVFFMDLENGDYIGICGENLGTLKAGMVVQFDHETGTLEKMAKDLLTWIKSKA